MSRDLEGIRARSEPGPSPTPLLGEAEYSVHDREVPGAAICNRAGRHARRPSIANYFHSCGRRGGTGGVGIGMRATRGSPRLGLGGGEKEPGILCR